MDKEQKAIARFQEAASMTEQIYGQPLLLCYSGGKDSDVLLHVAQKAGIQFEVQHSLTTVDAPETMKHVYSVLHDLENKGIKCNVDKHIKPDGTRTTMFNLIPKKMIPPLRTVRYCCAELKEGGVGVDSLQRVSAGMKVFAAKRIVPRLSFKALPVNTTSC